MSKIETGRLRLRRLELQALLDLYGVTDAKVRADLITLLRESGQMQYFPEYDLHVDAREMVELESECTRVEAFASMYLPGWLPIPEYAAAMIHGLEPWRSSEEVDHYVGLRMERQKVLEKENPPQVMCILDEGVVRRPVGGPSVMSKQLAHLLTLATRPPCHHPGRAVRAGGLRWTSRLLQDHHQRRRHHLGRRRDQHLVQVPVHAGRH